MLFRLVGLLCVVVLLNLALSWYFQMPVLTVVLQLLLLLKKIKWSVFGISFRSSLLAFVKKLPFDFGSGVLKRWSLGLGLQHVFTAAKNKLRSIFTSTIGAFFVWMSQRGFGTRLAFGLLITGGIIWLSLWLSIFWVLFIFLPVEVLLVVNLGIASAWKFVSNTSLHRLCQTIIRWLSKTKAGVALHKLNAAFEKKVGSKIEHHGVKQRAKLSQSKAGRKFLAWIDSYAPRPPPRHTKSKNPFTQGSIRSFQKDVSTQQKHKPKNRL